MWFIWEQACVLAYTLNYNLAGEFYPNGEEDSDDKDCFEKIISSVNNFLYTSTIDRAVKCLKTRGAAEIDGVPLFVIKGCVISLKVPLVSQKESQRLLTNIFKELLIERIVSFCWINWKMRILLSCADQKCM